MGGGDGCVVVVVGGGGDGCVVVVVVGGGDGGDVVVMGGGDGGDVVIVEVVMLFWWIGSEMIQVSGCVCGCGFVVCGGGFVVCGGGDSVGRWSIGIVSYVCFR